MGFLENNIEHIYRPAAIIIKKPLLYENTKRRMLNNLIVAGDTDKTVIATKYREKKIEAFSKRKAEYQEFIDSKTIKIFPSGDIDEISDASYVQSTGMSIFDFDKNGMYVVASNSYFDSLSKTSFPNVEAPIPGISDYADKTNQDIISVEVQRTAFGISKATVTIKNLEDKYTFQDNFCRKGETIFEPNDEVWIFLPNKDGNLNTVFRGLISTVTKVNDAGFRSIRLGCECMLKKLRISRTNLHPSLNVKESDNNAIQWSLLPELAYKDPFKFSLIMFAQSYTNIFSQLSTNPGEDLLIKYLIERNKQGSTAAKDLLLALVAEYAMYVVDAKDSFPGIPESNDFFNSGSKVEMTLYRERNSAVINAPPSYFSTPFASLSLNLTRSPVDIREPVAYLSGTTQPGFQLMFGDFQYNFSNWEDNFSFLSQLSDFFNFLFYTEASGVIRFAPPNLLISELTGLTNLAPTDPLIKSPDTYVLKDLDTLNYSAVQDDSVILNWLSVKGQWEDAPNVDASQYGVLATAVRPELLDKYGWHMGKVRTVIGLRSTLACTLFSSNLIDRQNMDLRRCTSSILGNSDLDINKNIFLTNDNTIYYVRGLSYNYEVGETFQMGLDLTWGRKPLINVSVLSSLADATALFLPGEGVLLNRATQSPPALKSLLLQELKRLLDDNKINYTTYVKYRGMADRETLTQLLQYKGYIWEDVSNLTFEDMALTTRSVILEAHRQDMLAKFPYAIDSQKVSDDSIIEAIRAMNEKDAFALFESVLQKMNAIPGLLFTWNKDEMIDMFKVGNP